MAALDLSVRMQGLTDDMKAGRIQREERQLRYLTLMGELADMIEEGEKLGVKLPPSLKSNLGRA